ncbi:MAG: hypothetical protein AB4426_14355 [Xenococcaceae cyanobacterium]
MTLKDATIEQLDLPVSVAPDGSQVTLRDFVKGSTPSLFLSSLTFSQRAEITAERIRLRPEVKIAAIGVGEIDKKRAIAEIKAQSPIGKVLVEAEQILLNRLIQEAESGRLKDLIEN